MPSMHNRAEAKSGRPSARGLRVISGAVVASAMAIATAGGAAQDAAPAAEPPQLTSDAIRQITERFRKHGVGEATQKPAGAIRLATYNIHDLYDDQDDPALTGRGDDLPKAMIPNRQSATAAALAAIDADIIALQEVESLDALRWYRDANLEGMGYLHAASEDVGHSVGMEQAVLSRFPIIETQTWVDRVIGEHPPLYRGRPNRYAGQPMTFRRSPLMVELALGAAGESAENADIPEADRLTLLVVHAKTGDGSEAWRTAEGAALAEIVAELRAGRPDRRIVVLGDFAVTQREGHLAPLLEAGLTDPFAALPESSKVATDLEGKRTCFVLTGDGVSPVGEPFVLGTLVPPREIDRRIGFGMPGFASDHYPVVCDIAAGVAE